MGSTKTIFHITTDEQWEAARAAGVYRHASLLSEGFIHCSYREQVLPSAYKHFSGQRDLIVLCIDVQALQSGVIVERGVDSAQDFPHIYGEVNLDAVQQVIPLNPDHPGDFLQRAKPFST